MVVINVVGQFDANLANKFEKDVRALKKGDVVLCNITSEGGEVDILKRMAAKVLELKRSGIVFGTYVPEYAYSCGFLFFLLGDVRDTGEKARVHYHAPRIELPQNTTLTANEMRMMYDDMLPYQEFCRALFREACDVSDEIFELIEHSELPMGRKELITLGIIN